MRCFSRWARLALLAPLALLIQACGGQPAAPTPTPEAAAPAAAAPAFTLPAANQDGSVSLADFRGQPVLLYFHMAVGWPPCLQQIVDLHADPAFQALNTAFVSIALDSAAEQAAAAQEYGISAVPLLVDADGAVSRAYDVLKWAVASGEPGHTFVLVNADGEIVWVRDYGAPDLADRTMYVPPADLVSQIRAALG